MSNRQGFGKAKEGNGITFFKVGEDESKRFRIFPPKGKLANSGTWAVYHQLHYGYSVPSPNDPNKTFFRPFLCVEEKDGDRVIVSCPECRKIEDTRRISEEQYSAEVSRCLALKMPQAQAEAHASKLIENHTIWLNGEKGFGGHKLDRKWYILAMGEDEQIGFLIIPHKAKKAIDVQKKKLKADEGIDLLDIDNGAWVEVTRTGNFRNTEYSANIVQEHTTVNGVRAKVTKVSGFTEEQLGCALNLPDLDSSSLVRRITRDQVRMLTEGSGAPEEVESILNLAQRVERKEESPRPRMTPPVAKAEVKVEPKPVVPPIPHAEIEAHTPLLKTQPPPLDPQAAAIAALQAQLASLMAAQAPAAPKVPAPVAPPKAVAAKDLSDDEFLSHFGPAK